MAKALNIPWDQDNIEKAHEAADYFGHSSLAGFIKVLLTKEIRKMESEKKGKKK
jgi:hypothetical protein